ncbi:hypothetical protein IHE45_03G027300 [Dioscorea alata]|uniref:Uncharacterized protein n=1 Tax=Dioscorea alata TaxID=55571 RepID=A0ACB7WJ72_DIOAL|nr:hypothetical protein IHE45_03G027300 [Dioscorea alata]
MLFSFLFPFSFPFPLLLLLLLLLLFLLSGFGGNDDALITFECDRSRVKVCDVSNSPSLIDSSSLLFLSSLSVAMV